MEVVGDGVNWVCSIHGLVGTDVIDSVRHKHKCYEPLVLLGKDEKMELKS